MSYKNPEDKKSWQKLHQKEIKEKAHMYYVKNIKEKYHVRSDREKLLNLGLRYCNSCKILKKVSEFIKNLSKKCGLDYHCKKCHRKYLKNRKNKRNIYLRTKLKKDLKFKIMKNLRNRLWKSLKGINKSKSTIELLGCSVDFLKQHLEKQFKPGMSWSNYGYYGWHVDHIRPCASFDLSQPEEQHKCFHYTNLQPLWAEDNLEKHDKI